MSRKLPKYKTLTLSSTASHRAFTIVELLIVLVVISILTAVVVVGYSGVTSSAREASLKSDLKNGSDQLTLAYSKKGFYPADADGLAKSDGTDFTYSGGLNSFCLIASNKKIPNKIFHVTESGSVNSGECSFMPTIIQAMTPAYCSTMTTYNGSNPGAIINLTDNRGGITRAYEVAKLADNNCWMLNSLRLGSATGTVALTSSDTNLTSKSSFTLPQLVTSGSANADTPGAYGPVPGDTGSGAFNYGYVYNWSAVTAGESRSSHDMTKGTAPNSICPANWRLPTGTATGEFAMLNAKMNNPNATAPSTSTGAGFYQNWLNGGPFKGVLSGGWSAGSFSLQGGDGSFWSGSARAANSDTAHSLSAGPSSVQSANSSGRANGFGVRCVLN